MSVMDRAPAKIARSDLTRCSGTRVPESTLVTRNPKGYRAGALDVRRPRVLKGACEQ
jgi:hypothetical protein